MYLTVKEAADKLAVTTLAALYVAVKTAGWRPGRN